MADTTTTMTDILQSQALTGDFLLLLADREALPSHPALHYSGSVDAMNSTTKRIPHLGLDGFDRPAAVGAEDAVVAPTNFSDGNTDIAVVRHTKVYESTDILRMVTGRLGASMLAQDAFMSYNLQLTNLIAAAAATFTTVVGTTDVDMTVAQALTAVGGLRIANVAATGGYMGLLHGYHWRDLIVDAGTGTIVGVQERNPGLASISVLKGGAFQGSWLGVDWFVSNYVPASGGDFTGGVFGYGGISWADGRHGNVDLPPGAQLIGDGRVLFELDRTARSATTDYASHSYLGVSKALEAGIQLLADGA